MVYSKTLELLGSILVRDSSMSIASLKERICTEIDGEFPENFKLRKIVDCECIPISSKQESLSVSQVFAIDEKGKVKVSIG